MLFHLVILIYLLHKIVWLKLSFSSFHEKWSISNMSCSKKIIFLICSCFHWGSELLLFFPFLEFVLNILLLWHIVLIIDKGSLFLHILKSVIFSLHVLKGYLFISLAIFVNGFPISPIIKNDLLIRNTKEKVPLHLLQSNQSISCCLYHLIKEEQLQSSFRIVLKYLMSPLHALDQTFLFLY